MKFIPENQNLLERNGEKQQLLSTGDKGVKRAQERERKGRKKRWTIFFGRIDKPNWSNKNSIYAGI